MANRPQHQAIAPKSLRKPIPSYPLKTGRNGISGTAAKLTVLGDKHVDQLSNDQAHGAQSSKTTFY